MKVGDLVEMRGAIGLLTEIKKNKFPPYQVWYKIFWNDTNKNEWVMSGRDTYLGIKKVN